MRTDYVEGFELVLRDECLEVNQFRPLNHAKIHIV